MYVLCALEAIALAIALTMRVYTYYHKVHNKDYRSVCNM
jgi:hypothetical protein